MEIFTLEISIFPSSQGHFRVLLLSALLGTSSRAELRLSLPSCCRSNPQGNSSQPSPVFKDRAHTSEWWVGRIRCRDGAGRCCPSFDLGTAVTALGDEAADTSNASRANAHASYPQLQVTHPLKNSKAPHLLVRGNDPPLSRTRSQPEGELYLGGEPLAHVNSSLGARKGVLADRKPDQVRYELQHRVTSPGTAATLTGSRTV